MEPRVEWHEQRTKEETVQAGPGERDNGGQRAAETTGKERAQGEARGYM